MISPRVFAASLMLFRRDDVHRVASHGRSSENRSFIFATEP